MASLAPHSLHGLRGGSVNGEVLELPRVLQDADEALLTAGQCVFSQGQRARSYAVVTDGCIKVFARSLGGREMVLYRVTPGELCTLTTTCLLGDSAYPAEAVAETDTMVRFIDAASFRRLIDESPEFRHFVFSGMSSRLADLMQRMEQQILESVHKRLAHCLHSRADADGIVAATHEQLAAEIGTAREVISRHLKQMALDGVIELQRGRIALIVGH